jgi:hypothetical protein
MTCGPIPPPVRPRMELVTEDRGGWISGPGLGTVDLEEATEEDTLAELQAKYPAWKFWKGDNTGKWWGCPPGSPSDLIDRDTLAALGLEVGNWEEAFGQQSPPGVMRGWPDGRRDL